MNDENQEVRGDDINKKEGEKVEALDSVKSQRLTILNKEEEERKAMKAISSLFNPGGMSKGGLDFL